MRTPSSAGALLTLLAAALTPAFAQQADSLLQAVREGRPSLSLRYRFEDVADDAVGERHARASTLRTALGFRTLTWRGWSACLEAENVAAFGNDLYNNAGAGELDNGVRDRPVVADPAGTELQQAFMQWEARGSTLQLGRREILLGDQRFVGNVGWRQNHQSFDAFTFSRSALDRLQLLYAYLDRVNRIDGSHHEMSSHLLQVAFELKPDLQLTLYGFLLDYDRPAQVTLSTSTLGAELKGRLTRQAAPTALWELEYATQRDYADHPDEVEAEYLFGLIGVELQPVTVKLAYEVLSGSLAKGQFRTPLATLHKFNGWADKFLMTPTNGLVDLYLQLEGDVGPVGWTVIYHHFDSETGGSDYGEELDLQVLYTAPWKQGLALKGALYDAAGFGENTEKWMVFTTFKI